MSFNYLLHTSEYARINHTKKESAISIGINGRKKGVRSQHLTKKRSFQTALFFPLGFAQKLISNFRYSGARWARRESEGISGIFRAFATPPGGMHGRLKCEVIFARALSFLSFSSFRLNRLYDCATAASPIPNCAPIVLSFSPVCLRQRYSFMLRGSIAGRP